MRAGLSEEQRRQLGEEIGARMGQLREEISHLETLTRPVSPDSAIGRLSRLEALNELAVNEKALASARTRQARLNSALDQLNDPGFGFCGHCDEPIPFARLLSIPETRLCVACAEKAEH